MTKTSEEDRRRDAVIKRMLDQKPKDQKQLKEELRTERGHWAPKPGRPKGKPDEQD